ncbi:hypothetical protein CCACVL1_06757 [Corchorus capsularis]|uniref:Retrovirus-related Pol polyprotein from transposon TNT 1-94-like beta-barrel domain-containing protein n=1 Tax=Corchorus capsularis TaxID=210143 RepID=A0A1R3JD85_COCAP|nr:hypothetical protein CCACVL1_06757 [Corchorus capsularis]
MTESSRSALKFEIEKFTGTNSFQMWQSTVTDVLVQQGLGDALEADKPSAMNDNRWRDIQRKARESFGLKMKVGTSLRAHINEFNRLVTQLASVDEVMKEVDKAVLLINSLTDRYDPVTRALMVGRKTLSLQDATSAIFEYDRLKETEKKDEENGALTVERGRTPLSIEERQPLKHHSIGGVRPTTRESYASGFLRLNLESRLESLDLRKVEKSEERVQNELTLLGIPTVKNIDRSSYLCNSRSSGRFNERGRSSSRPRVDMSSNECYYCHEMGHIKAYCKKLMEDLGDFMKSKEKNKGGVNVAAAADSEEYSDEETVVLMVQEEKKDTRDMWVFDSACSEHICIKKEWFLKLEKCDKHVYMANNGEEKIEGIGSVKFRLHDGSVKMFGNVRYVPKFTRNLISLGKLDSLGYGYSCRGGGLKITKGSMIVTKGVKNSKNLYEFIGSTIRGD